VADVLNTLTCAEYPGTLLHPVPGTGWSVRARAYARVESSTSHRRHDERRLVGSEQPLGLVSRRILYL